MYQVLRGIVESCLEIRGIFGFQEDLTPETTAKIIESLKKGERPAPGPQCCNRYAAEPGTGLTSLTSPPPDRTFGVRSDL